MPIRRSLSLCALLVLALSAAPRADAAVGCRSDPVIVVNGAVFDVFDTLQAAAASVRELDYTVTVPAGSVLGGVQLTAGVGFPERVSVVYSSAQPLGAITVAGTVLARPGVSPFPVTLTVTTLPLNGGSATGSSAGMLSVTLRNTLMLP